MDDVTTEAFLAACSEFYDQELPDCATEVTCSISDRRRLESSFQRLRALQTNVNVPVDVTATFDGTCNATGFDQLVLDLVETNAEEFATLLRSSSSDPDVITYFQSVSIEGFDPSDVVPTSPPSTSSPSRAPTEAPSEPLGTAAPTAAVPATRAPIATGMMMMAMGMGTNPPVTTSPTPAPTRAPVSGGMGMMMMMGQKMNGGMGMMMMMMGQKTMKMGKKNKGGMGMADADADADSDTASNRAWESFMKKVNDASSVQQPRLSAPVAAPSYSAWMKLVEHMNNDNN